MPCGKKLLCHVSQFWTIINNHNEQWKSTFQKKLCQKIFIMSGVRFQ